MTYPRYPLPGGPRANKDATALEPFSHRLSRRRGPIGVEVETQRSLWNDPHSVKPDFDPKVAWNSAVTSYIIKNYGFVAACCQGLDGTLRKGGLERVRVVF